MPDSCKKHLTNTVFEHRVQSTELTHGPSIWVDDGGSFCKTRKTLRSNAKPPKERQVNLLLDNHDSHLSVEALEYCKQNGVTVLSFPPQYKLQPLDVSVCGPLKTYVNRACDAWVTNHPDHSMTTHNILFIVISSLHFAASPGNIKVGFQVTGIYPFNRDTLHDEKFMGVTLLIDLALLWLQQFQTVTMNPQRRRLILQDHQNLLQRKKHILLSQRTFDLFLKPEPERDRM